MESLENLVELIDETVKETSDANKKVEIDAFYRLRDNLRDIPSILYFNPIFVPRFEREIKPDILWIYPRMGILIIEVKAWDKEFIERLRLQNERFHSETKSFENPIREANRFKEGLMNYIKSKLNVKQLPLSVEYVVYFPKLTRKEYRELKNEWFRELVFEECCIFRNDRNVAEKLIERLRRYHLEPKEEDVLALRRFLFPGLTVSKLDLRVREKEVPLMDVYQESLLYKYSKGYRILRGTAGSGKTVVLVGKAVQEKVMNKSKKVLIVTFANSLASEIKNNIESVLETEDIDNVTVDEFEVTTIDSLVQNLVSRYVSNNKKVINNKKTREILSDYLEKNPSLIPDDAKYDVILCDESQDFSKELFFVIRSLSKENGLIIFGVDETQRIYDGTDWKWIDVGFDARGKVTVLRKSYRNPGKIFKLAVEFLRQDSQLMKELKELDAVVVDEGIESIRKDDGEVEFYETNNEFEKVAEIVADLIEKGTNFGDIFILTSLEDHVKLFYRAISSRVPHLRNRLHYFSSHSPKKYKFVPNDKIVIMPYKSAKGLERPVVIVTGIGNLPYDSSKRVAEKRRDRRTLYVALTRAQKKLIITSYKEKDNGFAKDIKSIIEKTG